MTVSLVDRVVAHGFERNSRIIDPVVAKRFANVLLPDVNPVFTVARSLTRNDEDAQDVVQKTHLRAHRSLKGFRTAYAPCAAIEHCTERLL